jgi:hypothetical protein
MCRVVVHEHWRCVEGHKPHKGDRRRQTTTGRAIEVS